MVVWTESPAPFYCHPRIFKDKQQQPLRMGVILSAVFVPETPPFRGRRLSGRGLSLAALAPRQPPAHRAAVTQRRGLGSGGLTTLPEPGGEGTCPDLQGARRGLRGGARLSGLETLTHGRISPSSTQKERLQVST